LAVVVAALPLSQFGSFGGKKNLLAMLEINPQLLGHPACNLVTMLTWLFQLLREEWALFYWTLP